MSGDDELKSEGIGQTQSSLIMVEMMGRENGGKITTYYLKCRWLWYLPTGRNFFNKFVKSKVWQAAAFFAQKTRRFPPARLAFGAVEQVCPQAVSVEQKTHWPLTPTQHLRGDGSSSGFHTVSTLSVVLGKQIWAITLKANKQSS